MTLHLHHLTGCAPAPLAHYLKGLGVLRLVAEQKDPSARGFWRDEHFCLLTTLDAQALEKFFLETYAPTPFISPWNKGSGFFSPQDPALTPIEDSTAERFARFRAGIKAARAPLSELAAADAAVRDIKDGAKAKRGMTQAQKDAARATKDTPEYKRELAAAERLFKALKADLFSPCVRQWRGPHREWMDAAVVLAEEGKPTFPSMLGTGGNDGRIDFTNNAMLRLADLFVIHCDGKPTDAASGFLASALWRRPTSGIPSVAIGQFLPGNAGGANATTGPDGDAFVNPWDFILMLEGAILFTARATRHFDPISNSRASAPFAVRAHAVGHGSAGAEKSDRGEQWMPLWARPSTLNDLQVMLGEARMQLGRQVANRPLDVVRAISRLGTARGVEAFVRYGFLERNGQSNLAVPLGTVTVHERPRARLIDDVASWLDRLQRASRDKNAPSRLVHAERRLSDAVFAALTREEQPGYWQAVLRAASAMEAVLTSGAGYKAGPIPVLSPDWLTAADDGSAEWRLACALGSAAAVHRKGSGHFVSRTIDPVRHHWLPLQPGRARFAENDRRLAQDPRVVMHGRDPLSDLVALVQRRLIEAEQRSERRISLDAASGYHASLIDLAAVVSGAVDLTTVVDLARALTAVAWNRRLPRRPPTRPERHQPDEAWIALRLASLPWPLPDGRYVPTDPAMVRRLAAGDGTGAVNLALRHLKSFGFRPPLSAAFVDAGSARRWAASLAFPISKTSARRLASHFDTRTA